MSAIETAQPLFEKEQKSEKAMQTVLIASAVTLVIGILSVIMVWNRPRLRTIMLWLIPISLVITVLGWLTTLPAALIGSYTYISSFASGELGIPALLAKAVACLVVLPLVFGAYLMLRIHSRLWQRWVGASLILITFAGLFFWGYKHQQEVQAIQQAEAVRVAEEQQIAQAERARVEDQERLAAIAAEQTKQAAARAVEAQAKTEQQRLAAAAAMAEAERVRLQIEETRRREEEARREAARRADEERRRLERERQPQSYYATGPSWPKPYTFSVEAVERALAQKTTSNTVLAYATDGVVTIKDNRQIQRVWVNYHTERPPVQVVLVRNGLTVSLCGTSASLRNTCEAAVARFEVSRFDSQNPQGLWHLKVYGDIGSLKSWSVTLAPVVYHNGTVARL